MGSFVGHRYSRLVRLALCARVGGKCMNIVIILEILYSVVHSPCDFYLCVDALDHAILVLQFGAHIQRHVSQITDHRVHLAHVILHLVLACIVLLYSVCVHAAMPTT